MSTSSKRPRTPPPGLPELSARTRELADLLMSLDRGHPDLDWAREQLDAVTRRLAPLATREASEERPRPYYVGGGPAPTNPLTPAYTARFEGGELRGAVRFGALYEGPPGFVHGGMLAYFFDAVLGHHNHEQGHSGKTGRLLVRYRRPSPLFAELDYRAFIGRSGRHWILSRVELAREGAVLAEGEGLFIDARRFGRAEPTAASGGGNA